MKRSNSGFTLIELLVVMYIIATLAAIAVPNFSKTIDKAYYCEGYELANPIRQTIARYYAHTGEFPVDNSTCGLLAPEMVKGKYVQSITVKNGKITILFGGEASTIAGAQLILIPEVIDPQKTGIIRWSEERVKGDQNG